MRSASATRVAVRTGGSAACARTSRGRPAAMRTKRISRITRMARNERFTGSSAQYLNNEARTNDAVLLDREAEWQERDCVMRRVLQLLVVLLLISQSSFSQTPAGGDVTRATLDNGLRVVIVRDPLAPVA